MTGYLALRIFLAVALVGSVAIRFQTNVDRNDLVERYDARDAVVDLLQAHAVTIHENPVAPPKVLSRLVYFSPPQCSEKFVVLPFRLNVEALSLLERVTDSSYRLRYYYLDGFWLTHDRGSLFMQWAKHALLSIARATPYLLAPTAIVVAQPHECGTSSDVVDWRLVWDRDWQRRSIKLTERRVQTSSHGDLEDSAQ